MAHANDEKKMEMVRGILVLPALIFVSFSVLCAADDPLMKDSPVDSSSKVDLVIAYHLSPAITGQDITKYFVPFLLAIVEKAKIDNGDVRIALMLNSRRARPTFNLARYRTSAEIIEQFNKIDSNSKTRRSSGGSTFIEIRRRFFVRNGGDRPDVPNAIIFITDAKNSDDQEVFLREAETLKDDGVKIVTFGFGSANAEELRTVASQPVDKNAIYSQSYSSIASQNVIDSIHDAIPALKGTTAPIVITAPETTTEPARRAFDLRGEDRADVVFAVHFDPTRRSEDFDTLKSFIQSVVEAADVDGGRVHFSFYIDGRGTIFTFNTYNTNEGVYNAVGQLTQSSSDPRRFDLVGTLNRIRTEVFQTQNGDREGVPNAVILITDTNSGQNSQLINAEISRLTRAGIGVYSFGIGLRDKSEMENVAVSESNVFSFADYSDLQQYGAALRKEILALNTRQRPPTTQATTTRRREQPDVTVARPQRSCAGNRIDLVFVLDASTSVTEENFEMVKDFMKDFIYPIDIDRGTVRVGVVVYSTEVFVQFNLNSHQSKVNIFNAIDEVPYNDGNSNTADAIKIVRSEMFTQANGDRPDVPNVAIIVTDGISNLNARRTIPEAEQAHADGIHIFAIGIGVPDNRELDGMASKPVERNRFTVDDFSELVGLRNAISSALCDVPASRPIVTRPPPVVTQQPAVITSCPSVKIDFAIVLDASTSVTEENYLLMKDFVKDFLYHADIDGGNVRVSVVTYSTAVQIRFHLNKFRSKADVYNAIDDIPYEHGSTNTADAIKILRTDIFTQANGDRPDVPNIAIVVTDGVSNINSRRTIPEAEQTRASGAEIYALGIGLTDLTELDGIASRPIEKYRLTAREFSDLRNLRNTIYTALCEVPAPTLIETRPPPVVTQQPAVRTSCPSVKIDFAIVLDASTSVTEENYLLMKDFVKDFLYHADIDGGSVRVSVVTYSTAVQIRFHLNKFRSKADVYNAIDDIPYEHGSTNTADAIKILRTDIFTQANGDRPDVPNIAIVVTDGVSNINSRRTIPEAEQTRASGAEIYALGIGLTDLTELDGIASKPIEKYRITAREFSDLRNLRSIIYAALCEEEPLPPPAITETPTPRIEPTREIRVTFQPSISDCAIARADLVIVIDSSTSVTETNFRKVLSFVKDLLSKAEIESGNVRVGIALYSDEVYQIFQLNTYSRLRDILNAVDRIPYRYGVTNTAAALDVMRNVMFTPVNGDRPDVPNIAIVLTDGVSTINPEQTIPNAQRAHEDGIHIYCVGVGLSDYHEIEAIASPPASVNSFKVSNFDELQNIDEIIFASACPRRFTVPPPRPIPGVTEAGGDLLFMLDSSAGNREFAWMKSFVKDFTSLLDVNSGQWRIGALTYDTRARTDFDLNRYNDQNSILRAVDSLRSQSIRGNPNVAEAFDYARRSMFTEANGDRPEARNFVILLSANERSLNREQSYAAANRLKDQGAVVYSVGLNLRESTELDEISSKPVDDHRTLVSNEAQLREIPPKYRYSIGRTPPVTERPTVPQTTPTLAPVVTPSRVILETGGPSIDVIFMLDSAADNRVFGWMKSFVRNFLTQADIDSGQWKAAAVTFDSSARADFRLNRYNTQGETISAVDRLRNQRSNRPPNVAGAFDLVRTDVLTTNNGDRPEADNVIILLTGNARSLNNEQTNAAATRLKDQGTSIYTIGLNIRDSTLLDRISSQPAEDYRRVASNEAQLQEIPGIYRYQILNRERATQQPTIRQTTQTPAPRVTQQPTIQQTTQTPAPTVRIPEISGREADLIFLLDASVDNNIFGWMKSFFRNFVSQSDVDSGQWKIGVQTFDSSPRADIHLNRYNTQAEILSAADVLRNRRIPGNPDVAGALDHVRTNMFTSRNGDRPEANNYVILITGNERSLNSEESYAAASRLKDQETEIYTIGLNIGDTTEVDRISSQPADEYSIVVSNENQLQEIPGIYQYQILTRERATRQPTIQQTTTTEFPTTTTARRVPRISETGTDLVFVVDSSVDDDTFRLMKSYVRDFASQVDVDSGQWRIGTVTFDSRPRTDFSLNSYNFRDEVVNAVGQLRNQRISGRPNVAEAFDYVRTNTFTPGNGDRPLARNFVIFLTGNERSLNGQESYAAANRLKELGTDIYTIGFNLRDSSELDVISSRPVEEYRTLVNREEDLRRIPGIYRNRMARVVQRTTTQPTTVTTTQRTTTTRRPTTTTTRRTTTTTTRRPTTPKRIPRISETGTDLLFLLDSSVNNNVFGWMKSFVKDFATQVDVDSGQWRIGALTFDNRARADFHLNRYHFQDEVLGAVDKLRNQRTGGRPNVAEAFDYARRSMFTNSNGDRPQARNFVVLLSGNEKSLNTEQTYAAANRLKDLGTGIYSIGLLYGDSTELDEISSQPSDEYRFLITNEEELGEVPGVYITRMASAPIFTPRPPRIATTTTRRPFIIHEGPCTSKGDVIFLLDSSGSIGEENFQLIKNFTFSVISNLEIDNGFFRIGVIIFSDSSRVVFHLNTHTTKQEIGGALLGVPYEYGQTHTAEALRRIRTEMFVSRNGDRLDVPNLLVVITDGESNINQEETLPEGRLLKSQGTTIVTIAIGTGMQNNPELRGLTSPPVDRNMIEVGDYETLYRVPQVLVAPLCTDINSCEVNPCQNGGLCIDGLGSYICTCASGFYGHDCENSCGPPADVVFILDSSTSIGSANFDAMKSYVQTIVREMNILSCDINVGVIKYSSGAMIQFNLGTYNSEDAILRAVQAISYTPGRANMAEALRVVRTQMFTNRNGDRYNAPNFAFLLTDGSVEVNHDITASEVELLIDSGVRLIPVAVGLRDRNEVEYIAESQGITLVEVEDENSFPSKSNQVLEAVRDSSDACSSNPCNNDGQCVKTPSGFTCVCARGFVGDVCERVCNANADIVFIVDASRYNTGSDFRAIRRFLREVVRRLALQEGSFRVAVVEYGALPRLRLSFIDGDNKRAVTSAITGLRRQNGDPDLQKAARLVSFNLFGRSGDRKDVPNYAVIVTRRLAGLSDVQAINDLKSKGTKVIGIGVGLSSGDLKYLEDSVSVPTDQTLFTADTASDLERRSADFVYFDKSICEEKNLCLENPCQNGGTCESGGKTFVCICPPGYAGNDCSKTCDDRADVVFLIDSSGSVGFDNFRRIKDFVHHIIDGFNIGNEATQVGVATFSQDSRAEIYLNQYESKAKLQAAVSGITYNYGNTNTASGIKLVRSSLFAEARGNRPNVPDFLIVITDGLSNINSESTVPEAEYTKAQGIHVFSIGVGISDPWELNAIASNPPENNVFPIVDWDGLWDISDKLIDNVCRDGGVCAENPCKNDGTCVAGVGTFSCQCQQGYVGRFCEISCQDNKDIVFILDSSASVGPINFEEMLKYVSVIIKDLTAYGQDHRFSLITYSTDVKTIFSFNRYNTIEQILEAVQTTTYIAGSTNTASGLREAIQLFTSPDFGERATAKNVAILMTDGQSNVNYWDTIPAGEDLKSTGVKVVSIGINLENFDEINSIASSRKDVFTVSSFKSLEEIEHQIVESSCVNTV